MEDKKEVKSIKSILDNKYVVKLMEMEINELVQFLFSIEGHAFTLTLSELGEDKYNEIMGSLNEEETLKMKKKLLIEREKTRIFNMSKQPENTNAFMDFIIDAEKEVSDIFIEDGNIPKLELTNSSKEILKNKGLLDNNSENNEGNSENNEGNSENNEGNSESNEGNSENNEGLLDNNSENKEGLLDNNSEK